MDTDRGRKAVGGKIEIHMRIREPLVEKDVKVEKWKWLVIDLHLTSKKVSLLFNIQLANPWHILTINGSDPQITGDSLVFFIITWRNYCNCAV